jgi:hypothetical protein
VPVSCRDSALEAIGSKIEMSIGKNSSSSSFGLFLIAECRPRMRLTSLRISHRSIAVGWRCLFSKRRMETSGTAGSDSQGVRMGRLLKAGNRKLIGTVGQVVAHTERNTEQPSRNSPRVMGTKPLIDNFGCGYECCGYAFIASTSIFVFLTLTGLLTTNSCTGHSCGESKNQDDHQAAV